MCMKYGAVLLYPKHTAGPRNNLYGAVLSLLEHTAGPRNNIYAIDHGLYHVRHHILIPQCSLSVNTVRHISIVHIILNCDFT